MQRRKTKKKEGEPEAVTENLTYRVGPGAVASSTLAEFEGEPEAVTVD